MFYYDEIAGRKVLKSTLLDTQGGVEHFFTTRELPLMCGALKDMADECESNRELIADYFHISPKALIHPVQSHTANITIAQRTVSDYQDIDALVLSNKNLAIYLNFADCVPVMLWDSKTNVGAIAHAGWRGTAAQIVPKTVSFLENYYESEPKNILAAIGPAISMDNYQVDKDVFGKLISTLPGGTDDCWKFDSKSEKYNVDLKKINEQQLLNAGVKEIDMCGYCTYDTNDIFFSYRKENGETARHSAVMKLKEL